MWVGSYMHYKVHQISACILGCPNFQLQIALPTTPQAIKLKEDVMGLCTWVNKGLTQLWVHPNSVSIRQSFLEMFLLSSHFTIAHLQNQSKGFILKEPPPPPYFILTWIGMSTLNLSTLTWSFAIVMLLRWWCLPSYLYGIRSQVPFGMVKHQIQLWFLLTIFVMYPRWQVSYHSTFWQQIVE